MKTIIFSLQAARDFDGLPVKARNAVARALYDFAITGKGDVKKLEGRDGYRLRIGSYRVLFTQDAKTITVLAAVRRTSTTY
jgi:mRNA interferase RelE/StbE